jgi:hypothetical protein
VIGGRSLGLICSLRDYFVGFGCLWARFAESLLVVDEYTPRSLSKQALVPTDST